MSDYNFVPNYFDCSWQLQPGGDWGTEHQHKPFKWFSLTSYKSDLSLQITLLSNCADSRMSWLEYYKLLGNVFIIKSCWYWKLKISKISGKPNIISKMWKIWGDVCDSVRDYDPRSCPGFLVVVRGIFITTKPAKNVKPGRFKERYSRRADGQLRGCQNLFCDVFIFH